MKKIYLQPNVEVLNVNLRNTILDGSLQKFEEEADAGGWVKQEEQWDIWGKMQEEEEDEAYYEDEYAEYPY